MMQIIPDHLLGRSSPTEDDTHSFVVLMQETPSSQPEIVTSFYREEEANDVKEFLEQSYLHSTWVEKTRFTAYDAKYKDIPHCGIVPVPHNLFYEDDTSHLIKTGTPIHAVVMNHEDTGITQDIQCFVYAENAEALVAYIHRKLQDRFLNRPCLYKVEVDTYIAS